MSLHAPWGDREISRFLYREALFMRRGLSPERAEQAADALATRDQERDDRRMCVECESWQRGGKCFKASQGLIPGVVGRFYEVLPTTLQRCHFFSFQKP